MASSTLLTLLGHIIHRLYLFLVSLFYFKGRQQEAYSLAVAQVGMPTGPGPGRTAHLT
nr:hypothetical protein Q903MT_gene1500 [Picea sitchensis]